MNVLPVTSLDLHSSMERFAECKEENGSDFYTMMACLTGIYQASQSQILPPDQPAPSAIQPISRQPQKRQRDSMIDQEVSADKADRREKIAGLKSKDTGKVSLKADQDHRPQPLSRTGDDQSKATQDDTAEDKKSQGSKEAQAIDNGKPDGTKATAADSSSTGSSVTSEINSNAAAKFATLLAADLENAVNSSPSQNLAQLQGVALNTEANTSQTISVFAQPVQNPSAENAFSLLEMMPDGVEPSSTETAQPSLTSFFASDLTANRSSQPDQTRSTEPRSHWEASSDTVKPGCQTRNVDQPSVPDPATTNCSEHGKIRETTPGSYNQSPSTEPTSKNSPASGDGGNQAEKTPAASDRPAADAVVDQTAKTVEAVVRRSVQEVLESSPGVQAKSGGAESSPFSTTTGSVTVEGEPGSSPVAAAEALRSSAVIAPNFEKTVTQTIQEVKMQLEGVKAEPLLVRVAFVDEGIKAYLLANSEDTRRYLQDHLHSLRQKLMDAGIEVTDLNISLCPDSSDGRRWNAQSAWGRNDPAWGSGDDSVRVRAAQDLKVAALQLEGPLAWKAGASVHYIA